MLIKEFELVDGLLRHQLMIRMGKIIIFSSFNPENMARTSPHVLIRSGGTVSVC
jgi:hypothetical protein